MFAKVLRPNGKPPSLTSRLLVEREAGQVESMTAITPQGPQTQAVVRRWANVPSGSRAHTFSSSLHRAATAPLDGSGADAMQAGKADKPMPSFAELTVK